MPSPKPSPLLALALETLDALMVLSPRGWRRVRVDLARGPDGAPRVAKLSTLVTEATAKAKPELGIDPHAWLGVLNEVATDLDRALQLEGRAALGSAFAVERDEAGGATLELLDATDAVRETVAITAADAAPLIFTDPLFAALDAALPEAERAQRALGEYVAGHDEWNFDSQEGELQLLKGVLPWRAMPAQVLGTYAGESDTFLWGWANEALDPAVLRAVTAVREGARHEAGMSALLRPSLPCGEGVAWRLAQLAAVRAGARGVYRANYGPGVLFIAVMALP